MLTRAMLAPATATSAAAADGLGKGAATLLGAGAVVGAAGAGAERCWSAAARMPLEVASRTATRPRVCGNEREAMSARKQTSRVFEISSGTCVWN